MFVGQQVFFEQRKKGTYIQVRVQSFDDDVVVGEVIGVDGEAIMELIWPRKKVKEKL